MSPELEIREQTAIAEKWALARRLLPMVRDSFRNARSVEFDQARWLFLMDVVENYLPRIIGSEESMTEQEQVDVLSYLGLMHRGKDVMRSRKHVGLLLGLVLTMTEFQKKALDFLKVENDRTRSPAD